MSLTRNSPLTQRLIEDGLDRRTPPPLTDAQIMLERIEEAMRPGTPVAFRRRILGEAATFIREHHGKPQERAA